MTTIHARLKAARLKRFKTAAKFAHHIGIRPHLYHLKEAGKKPMTDADVALFAPALGVSVEWLLNGEEK